MVDREMDGMGIKKVACIGAGLIGQGWATVFSSKGYEVILQDLTDAILSRSLKKIGSNLLFLEANRFLRKGEARASLKRIKTSTSIAEAVRDADYVQESVLDNYAEKEKVFREMDAEAPDRAILASSSSGLMMTRIQKVTKKPGRCLLVHPCLPVHLIPLVEIVGGRETSSETVGAVYEWMRGLGKVPVILNQEVPGYIVNRLTAALVREAIDLVDKGIATPGDIDKAFCFGIGLRDPVIGPFLRMHLAGNGIEQFFKNYSESYRYRWETMETWTSIPDSASEKVIEGVREMEIVRTKAFEEIVSWRDQMLVKILKLIERTG
ncbi:MAG: 3-hydroxyacyl-CoA dehydrogenase family protein [Syntrophaceae bacterium]|nr:3-hydroxyacyl-CoA dehydrogenase family protein [Syntrophaceae bacterium]